MAGGLLGIYLVNNAVVFLSLKSDDLSLKFLRSLSYLVVFSHLRLGVSQTIELVAHIARRVSQIYNFSLI
nr:hypothetical protein BN993_01773 [Virgibacillus halodenitrificans]